MLYETNSIKMLKSVPSHFLFQNYILKSKEMLLIFTTKAIRIKIKFYCIRTKLIELR